MEEDIAIVSANTRNERIKNFFSKNKKIILISISIIVLIFIGYFSLEEIDKRKNLKLSNQYNSIVLNFDKKNKDIIVKQLILIINQKNSTYSPLALYFIIDNKLVSEKDNINQLFNTLIEKTKLEKEIKNLIIYKKALYNSESSEENDLIGSTININVTEAFQNSLTGKIINI